MFMNNPHKCNQVLCPALKCLLLCCDTVACLSVAGRSLRGRNDMQEEANAVVFCARLSWNTDNSQRYCSSLMSWFTLQQAGNFEGILLFSHSLGRYKSVVWKPIFLMINAVLCLKLSSSRSWFAPICSVKGNGKRSGWDLERKMIFVKKWKKN